MRFRITATKEIIAKFSLDHRGGHPICKECPIDGLVYIPQCTEYADGRHARFISALPGVSVPEPGHNMFSEEFQCHLMGIPHQEKVGFVFISHHNCIFTTGPLANGIYTGDLYLSLIHISEPTRPY